MTQPMSTNRSRTEAGYWLALQLVDTLAEQLRRGYPHLRDTDGKLLTTLDEVVRAILENRWPTEGVTNANHRNHREFNRAETRPIPEPA